MTNKIVAGWQDLIITIKYMNAKSCCISLTYIIGQFYSDKIKKKTKSLVSYTGFLCHFALLSFDFLASHHGSHSLTIGSWYLSKFSSSLPSVLPSPGDTMTIDHLHRHASRVCWFSMPPHILRSSHSHITYLSTQLTGFWHTLWNPGPPNSFD